MKILTIKLTAPIQSYGNEAHFERRTSNRFPSKSAIIGLLSAALGYSRDDSRITELNNISFAVRIEQPGQMRTEFQTVEWKEGTRKLTYRDGVHDAVYLVALGNDDSQLIEQLHFALKHPHFQLYLGRRANVPAGPLELAVEEADNPVQLLENLPWKASRWFQEKAKRVKKQQVEIFADANLIADKPSFVSNDNVVSFSQRNRAYSPRLVSSKRIYVDNPQYEEKATMTNHDIFESIQEGGE